MKPDALPESERLGLSPTMRTVVSLLLIVHIFLAAVAMSANLRPPIPRSSGGFSRYSRSTRNCSGWI